MLRGNQKNAINASLNNNFKSGVHFHATGTGKSWIALELLLKYNNLYNNLYINLYIQKLSTNTAPRPEKRREGVANSSTL